MKPYSSSWKKPNFSKENWNMWQGREGEGKWSPHFKVYEGLWNGSGESITREKYWTRSVSMWSILSSFRTWRDAFQLQSLLFLLSSGGQEDCILSYEPVTRQESKFHLLFCHCSLYFSFHILGASRAVSLAMPAPDSLWLLFIGHSVYRIQKKLMEGSPWLAPAS